ncbi:conserved hypothetical protein [Ricinus communis]|uniref:Ubiquitin-like domain-containing protein n=1 Tax=Ricinus communis TaxID=3988 RepID=B9SBI7_RICCO|nr:conserved hypothetical protein [Ricinus communis]|eukprot:XP_002523356.1 replication stress response regulator SDE2 [Ricinus communis]
MEDTNRLLQIFVKLLDGKTAILRFTGPQADAQLIKQRIFEITKIPTHTQRLICNGAQLRENSVISTPECTVHLLLRLIGGKGGFGSLLRGAATKAGQKKTNNFDACRDMSGRRLRHVNAEKRLEEWKAEEEERRMEKIAEEFIKKNVKKGKKGVGDGEADKYVAKYREDSAKCAKEVEEAVREACANGNGKRKGKVVKAVGLDAKRLKIWMGKRTLGDSDSEDNSDDEENEKSAVLNIGNNSDISKEADGSSDSVTGGKQEGDCSGGASCESGSEEEKDAATAEQTLQFSSNGETVPSEGDGGVELEVKEQQNAAITCSEAAVVTGIDVIKAEKNENDGLDSQSVQVSSPARVEVIETKPITVDSETVVVNEKATDLEKPLNFDDYNAVDELEALGIERLKTELQARGLKCGGTLQERAARLFLLKTTPLDKLPRKLFAKK